MPRRPAADGDPGGEPAARLEPRTEAVVVAVPGDEAPPGAPEKAEIRPRAQEPARPRVHGEAGLVELSARVLAPRDVATAPDPDPVPHRMLVLAARPERKAHPGRGRFLRIAPERKAEDLDDALVRRGPDVALRREGGSEVDAPALAGAERTEEALHVGDDRRGQVARENPVEVFAREGVLALEEECPCELEANADELRAVDQHDAKRRDGLVQQCLPPLLGHPGLPGGLDRGESDEEVHARLDRAAFRMRPQHAQRIVESPAPDQLPCFRRDGGRWWRRYFLRCTPMPAR